MPATPSARSVCPYRHGRPAVSLTTTATLTRAVSARSSRSRRALASGSSGSSTTDPGATLDASTPAAAITTPLRVSTMLVCPRRATTRTVSSSMARSLSLLTTPPSDLLTTLLVTTRTSPSPTNAATRSARPVPATTSPMPSGEKTSRRIPLLTGSAPSEVEGGHDHLRSGVVVGHHQRHRATADPGGLDPGDQCRVDRVDQPAVDHSAGRPRAVVFGHTRGRDLDADRAEQLAGHAVDVVVTHDSRDADHRSVGLHQGIAHARHSEDRADRDDGVRRRQHHEIGLSDRLEHTGCRGGPI